MRILAALFILLYPFRGYAPNQEGPCYMALGDLAAVPFDEGVARSADLIDQKLRAVEDGGIIYVAVYGESNSGKSELMSKLKAKLEKEGHRVVASAGSTRRLDIVQIEAAQLQAREMGQAKKVVYLFHCSWR